MCATDLMVLHLNRPCSSDAEFWVGQQLSWCGLYLKWCRLLNIAATLYATESIDNDLLHPV